MARNAKDNAVSYFHFCRMNSGQPEPGDWSTYLQNFMEAKGEFKALLLEVRHNIISSHRCPLINHYAVALVVYGSWYDHVNAWWEKKQTYSKLHYLFYEDLSKVRGSISFSTRTHMEYHICEYDDVYPSHVRQENIKLKSEDGKLS